MVHTAAAVGHGTIGCVRSLQGANSSTSLHVRLEYINHISVDNTTYVQCDARYHIFKRSIVKDKNKK
jgi:hypothetical protein